MGQKNLEEQTMMEIWSGVTHDTRTMLDVRNWKEVAPNGDDWLGLILEAMTHLWVMALYYLWNCLRIMMVCLYYR